MRKGKKIVCLFMILITIIWMFTGCGNEENDKAYINDFETQAVTKLEESPILDYAIPSVGPSILVNQTGYEAKSEKTALITAKELPDTFHIFDKETEEEVFSGNLRVVGFDEKKNRYTAIADFSTFENCGVYYLECDIIGRSYSFRIEPYLYENLLCSGMNIISEYRKSLTVENMIPICNGIATLLLSNELYGDIYEDTYFIEQKWNMMAVVKQYVEQLITFQSMKTGAVMQGDTPLLEETAWLCAVLAKFGYSYQKIDSVYANACLQASDKAWKYLEKQEDKIGSELRYFCIAELYRATGKYSYRTTLKEIAETLSTIDTKSEQTFGTLTYAATKRKIDIELCGTLLGGLLTKAEQIALHAKDDLFGIGCSVEKDGLKNVIFNGVIMASINYVITNNEYATIIENYYHYLSGVNETASVYVMNNLDGTKSITISDTDDFMNTTRCIFLISEMMSHVSK